jgi:predicted alpha/beta hydrolase family esterase
MDVSKVRQALAGQKAWMATRSKMEGKMILIPKWVHRTANRFSTWLTKGTPARVDRFLTKGWPSKVFSWVMALMNGIIKFDRSAVAVALSLTSLIGVGALVANQAASQHTPNVTVHVSVPVCTTKG